MNPSKRVILWSVSLALIAVSGSALAVPLGGDRSLAIPGYTPKVPVSAFARPLGWFDRSRFHVSASVSMGSGFGRGAEALQVTSLSYQFGAPLWMAVNVGNSWGSSSAQSGRSFFLEGLDLAYKPNSNVLLQVHYRDVRSPLQLSRFADTPWGSWAP